MKIDFTLSNNDKIYLKNFQHKFFSRNVAQIRDITTIFRQMSSAVIFAGGAVLWIRIKTIRIQVYKSFANSNPDPKSDLQTTEQALN